MGFGVAASVFVHTKGFEHAGNGVGKAHGQQHHIGWVVFFGTRHFAELAILHFHMNSFEAGELAVFAHKGFGGDGKFTLATLFVAGAGAQFQRPIRPHHRFVFLLRGLGHNLELGYAGRTMAVGGAHAVRTRVAAANHDDVFAVCTQLVFELVTGVDFVLLG